MMAASASTAGVRPRNRRSPRLRNRKAATRQAFSATLLAMLRGSSTKPLVPKANRPTATTQQPKPG